MSRTTTAFIATIPDESACLEALVQTRYPNGIYCPACQKVTPHYRTRRRPCYACQWCAHNEYPRVGTVFESTRIPLRYWVGALRLLVDSACRITASAMARELGVHRQTAMRLRAKLIDATTGELNEEAACYQSLFISPMSGIVEPWKNQRGGSPPVQAVGGNMIDQRPDPALVATLENTEQLPQGNGQHVSPVVTGNGAIRLRGKKSSRDIKEAIGSMYPGASRPFVAPSANSNGRWTSPRNARQLAGQANKVATMLLNGEISIETAQAYATMARTISTLLGEEISRARYMKTEPDLTLEVG